MASSAGSMASSANKREDGEDSNCCLPTSPTPQHVQKGMHFPGRREGQGIKAPRGMYSEKTSPAESPPVIKSPLPVLWERPKHTQPSPPNELVKLHQIVKKSTYCTIRHAHTTGTY